MRNLTVESFAEFDVPSYGIPELRSYRGAKNMSVLWYGGSMLDYARSRLPDTVAFEAALDCDGMSASLLLIWKECKPLCDRWASFDHGDTGGSLRNVPHAAGEQAVALIRAHFTRALEILNHDRCAGGIRANRREL
jgi:hypothetical protein